MVVPSVLPSAPESASVDLSHNGLKPKKHKRHRFVAVLEQWLTQNGHLYPSREQKDQLASVADMTYNQVNRWFANRRRKQNKLRANNTSPTSSSENCEQEPNPPELGADEDVWNDPNLSTGQQRIDSVIHSSVPPTDSNNNKGNRELLTQAPKAPMATPPALNPYVGLDVLHQHYLTLLSQRLLPAPVAGLCGPSPWIAGIYPTPYMGELSTLDRLGPMWSPREASSPSSHGSLSVPPGKELEFGFGLSEKEKNGLALLDVENLTEEESIAVSVLARFASQQQV